VGEENKIKEIKRGISKKRSETIQFFLKMVIFCFWNFGSSVGIVSDYRLDDRGSILGRSKGFFL
jgi:hypothetical protein